MLEDILDWAFDHMLASVLAVILILALLVYSLLSLTHAIPWMGLDGRWHTQQVCHMEQQEIVETHTSYSTYTYTDSKGRVQTGTHSTTTYVHTGRYHDVQVCSYE